MQPTLGRRAETLSFLSSVLQCEFCAFVVIVVSAPQQKRRGQEGKKLQLLLYAQCPPSVSRSPKKVAKKVRQTFAFFLSHSLLSLHRGFFYQGEVFDREQRVNLGTPKGGNGEGLGLARSQGGKWRWKNLSGLEWGP